MKHDDRSRFVALVLACMLLLAFSGCGLFEGITIPDTPHGKYLAARTQFNKSLNQYLTYYDQQTPEVQAEWKVKYDPKFLVAASGLDIWSFSLDTGAPTAEQEAAWLSAKNALIDILVEIGGQ